MENFAASLAEANLASKSGMADFEIKTNFHDKLKHLSKKVTSNKTKHVEIEKKITDLTNKVAQISEKGYDFLLGRVENFLVFALMLSSLILDSSEKVTNWMSTRISTEKNKPFDTSLEPRMSNLVNGRVILKFNNSVLVHKSSSSLYSSFISNLPIVYGSNKWQWNPGNDLAIPVTVN